MNLRFRPIDTWPGALTPASERKHPPFSAGWKETLLLLEREIDSLGRHGVRFHNDVILQVAAPESAMRLDGGIRADARTSHPGVIVSFESVHGPLKYWTDTFEPQYSASKLTGWQANVRAIALGLEALRKVERYGIANRGEQYRGWKELPSGIPLSEHFEPEELTVEQAARIVVGWVSEAHEQAKNARTAIEDADYRRYAYRQAVKHVHPDAGADGSDPFLRLQEAMKVLEENDQ